MTPSASRIRKNNRKTWKFFFALNSLFRCMTCRESPVNLYTAHCGYSRCLDCTLYSRCHCSQLHYDDAAPNYMLIAIIEKFNFTSLLRPVQESSRHQESTSNSPSCKTRSEAIRPHDAGQMKTINLHFLSDWKQLVANELQCSLCIDTICAPVVTPCGHTLCRECLETHLDYESVCPLCREQLYDFNIAAVRNCRTVRRILKLLRLESHVEKRIVHKDLVEIPVLVCTIAYPTVICTIKVSSPRDRRLVRECTKTGGRFGVITTTPDGASIYGTVVEIRDILLLRDGRSIINTIGISRFKIRHQYEKNGYKVAYVDPINDLPCYIISEEYEERVHNEMRHRCLQWLQEGLGRPALELVLDSYGGFPAVERDWQNMSDGPGWVWWFLAVLPLAEKTKLQLLASRQLTERLIQISRAISIMTEFSTHLMTSPDLPRIRRAE